MHASAICLTVLSVAATLVSARPSISYLAPTFQALSGAPNKRQGTSTPSQCTSICDPVSSSVIAQCTVLACCTQPFDTSYYNCLLCVGTADNVTDYSQAQSYLDYFYVTCYNNGYPLQKLSLPGQNPSRTLSTSASVGPSSATSASSTSVITSPPKSTVNPSVTSPASSAKATGSSTATSSTSTGAAMGVGSGKGGIWALTAVAVGLVIL